MKDTLQKWVSVSSRSCWLIHEIICISFTKTDILLLAVTRNGCKVILHKIVSEQQYPVLHTKD